MATIERKEQFGGWTKRRWKEIRRKVERRIKKEIKEGQADW